MEQFLFWAKGLYQADQGKPDSQKELRFPKNNMIKQNTSLKVWRSIMVLGQAGEPHAQVT